jgi:hypothetical protein
LRLCCFANFSIDNYIMTTPEQINYAKQVGYEHGYLNKIEDLSDRMTLETTSQEQFKHNKELSKAWQEGETKYYQDMHNKIDHPDDVSELKVGEYGPFAVFYKKKGGKKSKRHSAKQLPKDPDLRRLVLGTKPEDPEDSDLLKDPDLPDDPDLRRLVLGLSKKKGGKKSKRRCAQKKRKTRRSRK